jgi:hypothetical protein
MVDLIIISASGFGNDQDDDSHILRLHYQLRDEYQGLWPRAEILYRPWDAPWHHLARRLNRASIPGCPTVFLAHSYGCGWGLKRFEQQWRRCGRTVDLAILIDPIPRAFNVLFVGNLFSLTRWGVVRTRARHVLAVRQVNNIPAGRRVQLRNPDGQELEQWVYGSRSNIRRYAGSTSPSEIVYDDTVTHTTIDGRPVVQGMVMDRIRSYLAAIAGS